MTEPVNIELRVGQYVALRDKLDGMKKEFDERKKPLQQAMDQIEGVLMQVLEESESESIKTKAGTCYATTRYTASLADADAFMKHVLATQKFDLLDRRANATAVKDYVKEHGSLPPGCNLNALKTVNIRRAP